MRLTLFGCGRMGRGTAYALAQDSRVTSLKLVDRDRSRATDLACWIQERTACAVTVTDAEHISNSDAIAVALPWRATRDVVHLAAAANVPLASITRPPTDQITDLSKFAFDSSLTALLPIGLEPGLTELLAIDVARRLNARTSGTQTLKIFCGGLSTTPRQPWGYVAHFGGERPNHLPVAQHTSYAVERGRLVEYPRFSGLEEWYVPGIGMLEAYHDGMVPWMADHPAVRTANCTQKTLRWPGFAAAVTNLASLGLLDETPILVDGFPVVPKRLVEHVLAPRMIAKDGDTDIVALEVSGTGAPDAKGNYLSIKCSLLDRGDPALKLPAMTRTTGFTLAAAALLLADRTVSEIGWLRPHLVLGPPEIARIRTDLEMLGVRWVYSEDSSKPGHSENWEPTRDDY